jgi:inorganic phosphate transporter, PiT family
MTDVTLNSSIAAGGPVQPASRPNLDKGFNPLTMILFFGILAAGLLFVAYSIYSDVEATGTRVTTLVPFILLFVALLIALGFEFVNGFHDTANAVATVIYTHSLPAEFAVMGPASSTSSACCSPRARSPSASSRCSRSN